MRVPFSKYHGLGNDFLIVDLRTQSDDIRTAAQDSKFVTAVCDRQFGLGADGVLALLPPVGAGSIARMRVLNSDGSEAEMCGNGIRCVARYLQQQCHWPEPRMVVDTGAGPLECVLEADGQVTVAMGAPRFTRGELPMIGPAAERAVDLVIDAPGIPAGTTFTGVSMGNPHVIAFVSTRDEAERLARGAGPVIETHAAFPRRTNVEFAAMVQRNELDLIVWERGCGITLACGTGASATVVAACLLGHCDVDTRVAVHLLGGTLQIRVGANYENVWMTGPALRVARGEMSIPEVLAARRP